MSIYTNKYTVTGKMIADFGSATGDMNPVHFDESYAAKTRFKKPIAHGMLTSGLISASLVDCFGEGTIYVSQQLNFKAPVYYKDEVDIVFEDITEIANSSKVSFTAKAFVGDTLILEGTGTVIPGDNG
jgi:3-hydroxybutyryl-CoA dehydratase